MKLPGFGRQVDILRRILLGMQATSTIENIIPLLNQPESFELSIEKQHQILKKPCHSHVLTKAMPGSAKMKKVHI